MKIKINLHGISVFAENDARPYRTLLLNWWSYFGSFAYIVNYRDRRGMHVWTFSPYIKPVWKYDVFGAL